MLETIRTKLWLTCALMLVAPGDLPAQSSANAMNNPYRMVEDWGKLPHGVRWGASIGMIPDGEGGAWLHHRSDPPIVKLDRTGKAVQTFGDGMFVQAHGFCMDHDGNLWAGDSGPFGDDASKAGRGYQFFVSVRAGRERRLAV